jgi:perosamine synthetase
MDVMDHVRLGFNYRMSELSAAVGVGQLERLDEMLARRATVAEGYRERLADVEGLALPCADRGEERRGWFVFVVQVPDATQRDRVIARLETEGIASKPYLPCIHLQPYYREAHGYRPGALPVTEAISASTIALPFFPEITEEQIERVCAALDEAVRAGRAAGRRRRRAAPAGRAAGGGG